MEEGCGERGKQRKRVSSCKNGCRNCHGKGSPGAPAAGLKTRISGSHDENDAEVLKACRIVSAEAAAAGLKTRISGSCDEDDAEVLKACRMVSAEETAAARKGRENAHRGEYECGSSNFEDVHCEKCERDDDEDKMLLCDKCDRGFHMYCLSPIAVSVPLGDWFCPLCSRASQVLEFPKVQKKIVDFFRIQKLSLRTDTSEVKKRRRHSGGFTTVKRSRKLVLHTPAKDPGRRLEQMASLATALISTGVAFSDELTYLSDLAPRLSNCASMEKGGMQVMGKDDKATFDLSKAMCRIGQWPPLMVAHDKLEGFVVEADSPIKDMTIIAEYTGDVDFMCNRMSDEGNSIMGLLFTENPSKELVICPDKRGNLARFVSGINNHTPDGRKKQNVRCVRFDVDGEARALLIAIRDIPNGERLYYDYNGYHKDYPTEHFV